MAFFILPLLSVEGWWQGQYEKGHVLIYLSHILPGHKRANNMLLPRRQITRHKLCFYYTCKFGVISIKYVINSNNVTCQKRKGVMLFKCHFQQYFSYIMAVSFIGGGNQSTQRKPQICSLTCTLVVIGTDCIGSGISN